jgi:transposase
VRRDTGESYQEFLMRLAKASGIETPQREDLAKLDRKRPKKGSNTEWIHPHDPDARITKMKDGRTHLAHKAEHAVDLETGAIVAVTLHAVDQGDTQTLPDTLVQAIENVKDLPEALPPMQEVVTDKGYHSNETVRELAESQVRSYLSEPKRGRRQWDDQVTQQAVYANRRRIRGVRGRRLLRRRGELLERPFAHCYETGGMRRTHLRGRENILKRLLVHVAACNLGLVMRSRFGFGTPRGLSELLSSLLASIFRVCRRWRARWTAMRTPFHSSPVSTRLLAAA